MNQYKNGLGGRMAGLNQYKNGLGGRVAGLNQYKNGLGGRVDAPPASFGNSSSLPGSLLIRNSCDSLAWLKKSDVTRVDRQHAVLEPSLAQLGAQSAESGGDTGRSEKKILEFAAQRSPDGTVDVAAIRQMLSQWLHDRVLVLLDNRYLSLALRAPEKSGRTP